MNNKDKAAEPTPKILKRTETIISPWVRVVGKDIQFTPGTEAQTYHSLAQGDYVVVLARDRRGLIPVVRQFRPAIEVYTWEFPGGLVDPGESPESSGRREIMEEIGMQVDSIRYLGQTFPDPGRFENRFHGFYATLSEPVANFRPEPGLEVDYVTHERLLEMIRNNQFQHQLHLGVLLLTQLLVPELKWSCKTSA